MISNERLKELRLISEPDFSLSEPAKQWVKNLSELLDAIDVLKADNARLREGILSLCKAYCAGREAYSGKNRHEPNCAAWELGDLFQKAEEER